MQMGKRNSLIDNFREGVIHNNRVDPTQLDIVKSITLCGDLGEVEKLERDREVLIG